MIPFNFLEQPGCPWVGYELGNLVTCEESLCAWIRQPANTYSNLGLFIVAIYLFYLWKQSRRKSYFDFGLLTLFIGVSSVIAHASQIRFFGFFDYSSQFVLFAYLISFSLHRYRPTGKMWRWILTVLIVFLSVVPQIIYKKSGLYLFGIVSMIFLILEWINLNNKAGVSYRDLYRSLIFFGIAFICFVLDSTRLVCFSENHFFQLHAFWHIFVAISLFYIARFYSQFSYLIQEKSYKIEVRP
jgi:hypothetical protein